MFPNSSLNSTPLTASNTLSTLRLFIVADNLLARVGLAALLAAHPGWSVAGQSSGDDDLSEQIARTRPEVLVWDFGWSPAGMLERLVGITDSAPPTLALLPDETHAGAVWSALHPVGTRGLLLRDSSAETLQSAIAALAGGLIVLDPVFVSSALTPAQTSEEAPLEALTPRENEVLQLLAEGLANKAIAGQLKISENTVKFHVNAILSKLNAQSRTEAVVRATRAGLIIL